MEGDAPIQIGGRAIDLLIALVESAGATLSHAELMARAWPNVTVEPISLRVHISAIRRALRDGENGARYIVNISGRGYRFVAPVERLEAASPRVEGVRLSQRMSRIVGREDFIDGVVAQLTERPLVSIVGGGGIGKTAVALAAAERLSAAGRRVAFVDLAMVSSAALVPVAIARVIGAPHSPGFDVEALSAFVADQNLLLVLDSCEHLIEDLAPLVETLRWTAPGLRILATSREPLRIDGEWLMHAPPLDVPDESAGGEALLGVASVQLFLDRAIGGDEGLELSERNLAIIGKLCRKLEGIPLAIELVATRIDLFGLEGLLANLDDRFLLVARGRRTALPRHQTMRATLDWSHDLLPPTERKVFRRLSVFRGVFTIDQALKVAADDELSELDILEGLPSLAQRSMIARGQAAGQGGYRFFSINRFYAAEKLREAGEAQGIRRRHAANLLAMLEQAQAAWSALPRSTWAVRLEPRIDDLRSALDWCFDGGDPILGARLTAAWVPVGLHLALIDEFSRWTAQAMAGIDALAAVDPKLERQVRRLPNLVQPLVHGRSPARTDNLAMRRAAASFLTEPPDLITEDQDTREVREARETTAASSPRTLQAP
jgi:predicted ATPase/DNA-binding winged helix-turn-helix (wHTH) protein